MASPLVTYGKRKPFKRLAAFGSRRKQRHGERDVDKLGVQRKGSMQNQGLTANSNAYLDTIDDIASALLHETTTVGITLVELEQPSNSPPTRTPTKYVHPNRVEKQSPPIPRKSSKRLSSKPRTSSSGPRRETGLQRPLPQSKTVAFNEKKDVNMALPMSKSVPSAAICHKNAITRVENSTKHDGEEISRKVAAVLAASAALKPIPETVSPDSISSKITRMMNSRVFSKMSSAMDRLHSKRQSRDSGIRGNIKHPFTYQSSSEDVSKPDLAPLDLAEPQPPVSSIEIRLNEGGNLKKRKIQKLVGAGLVARKPLVNDGKSLRSRDSAEDPFSDSASMIRTPTRFECRLKSTGGFDSGSSPGRKSDLDLEGVLDFPPLAFSTPRIRLQRPPVTEGSPTRHIRACNFLDMESSADGETNASSDKSVTIRKTISMAQLRDENLGFYTKPAGLAPGLRTEACNILHAQPNRSDFVSKKHPSPSKQALETLSRDLRLYSENQPCNTSEKSKAELTTRLRRVTRAPILTESNGNKLRGQMSAADERPVANLAVDQRNNSTTIESLPVASQKSKIPRPSPRLVPLRYPSELGAMDVDELQWNDAAYYVGTMRVCKAV